LLGGSFLRWPVVDQVAAAAVLAGIVWLMYRTAE
jgi:divalent metal cation (Fe/Co/Zn/Cd) transporter